MVLSHEIPTETTWHWLNGAWINTDTVLQDENTLAVSYCRCKSNACVFFCVRIVTKLCTSRLTMQRSEWERTHLYCTFGCCNPPFFARSCLLQSAGLGKGLKTQKQLSSKASRMRTLFYWQMNSWGWGAITAQIANQRAVRLIQLVLFCRGRGLLIVCSRRGASSGFRVVFNTWNLTWRMVNSLEKTLLTVHEISWQKKWREKERSRPKKQKRPQRPPRQAKM